MFNNLNNKVLSIFGLAFKANTNDVRESAAVYFLFCMQGCDSKFTSRTSHN